jgi:hypothetical protein
MPTRKDRCQDKCQSGELMAMMKASEGKTQLMTEAWLESMEPAWVEIDSELEHPEVLKEEASVKSSGALKKQYEDRHLEVGRRENRKERTQGNGVSRKKLAAARRWMTRLAGVAPRKGLCRQGQGQDTAVQRTQKGRTDGKRRWPKPECNNGRRDRGAIRQLCLRKRTATGNGFRRWSRRHGLRLRSEKTSGRIFGKTIGTGFVKQIVGPSIKLRKMNVRTLWRDRPPPKRKKRLHTE